MAAYGERSEANIFRFEVNGAIYAKRNEAGNLTFEVNGK